MGIAFISAPTLMALACPFEEEKRKAPITEDKDFAEGIREIMVIILGGTGHVGSAVAEYLLEKGQAVTIITHRREKTAAWEKRGAQTAVVDVNETAKLREIFKTGTRLFLLNPPADPTGDTVEEEERSLSSILHALENSGIEKTVAESTGGARPGEGIGDLGVLYAMEKRLEAMKMPTEIIRAGYYMSNWDGALATAKDEGVVHTLYPLDFKLPMVAPQDIGKVAANFLIAPVGETRIHYVEGPEPYSSADVAAAFSRALHKPVKAVQTPPEKWLTTLKQMGFSDKAARSMAAMTKITLENPDIAPSPIRGETTLRQYVENLVLPPA